MAKQGNLARPFTPFLLLPVLSVLSFVCYGEVIGSGHSSFGVHEQIAPG
jgi:hypothetical protein